MSVETMLIPMAIGAIGYIIYSIRDFLFCLFFVRIKLEELGEFPETLINEVKGKLFNRNWVFGRFSMTKTSSNYIKRGHDIKDFLGIDSGFYFGTYKKKFIIISMGDFIPQGYGGDWMPRHSVINIITFRWNESILFDLINQAKRKEKPIDFLSTGSACESVKGRGRQGFDGLFLPNNMKKEIEDLVVWFVSKEGEEWYKKMKQPYKLVLLFHGDPGTGKTAIAKAIADVTMRSLNYIKLVSHKENSEISHETMSHVISCVSDVVLLDEIDKLFLQETTGSKVDPGTLLGLLNGDMLYSQIIILTANDLEKIPESFREPLLRSRRVDKCYYLTYATDEQKLDACQYFQVEPNQEIMESKTMAEVIDVIMKLKQNKIFNYDENLVLV